MSYVSAQARAQASTRWGLTDIGFEGAVQEVLPDFLQEDALALRPQRRQVVK